jgi:MFS family permease
MKYFILTSLGFVVGPFIGTILNYALGYTGPLYLYSLILLIGTVAFYLITPPDIKIKATTVEKEKRLHLKMVAFKREVKFLVLIFLR